MSAYAISASPPTHTPHPHTPTLLPVTCPPQAFPYATAVWKEALRLLPPGTLWGRQAETGMEIGGYFVPAGTQLHVSRTQRVGSACLSTSSAASVSKVCMDKVRVGWCPLGAPTQQA